MMSTGSAILDRAVADTNALRAAIERAAWVEVAMQSPNEDCNHWYARAIRDVDADNSTGTTQRTVATATGDSEFACLINLGNDLNKAGGAAWNRLDAILASLTDERNSILQGKAQEAA